MKPLIKWTLLALMWSSLSASAWATNATTLMCGSDPAILTPIYPVLDEKLQIDGKPDVVFQYEGSKSCSSNDCFINVVNGTNGEIISKIPLGSNNITYCRNKDWPIKHFLQKSLKNEIECKNDLYIFSRIIVFEGKLHDIDVIGTYHKKLRIDSYQNKNLGDKSSVQCGSPWYKDKFGGDELYIPIENRNLLEIEIKPEEKGEE